MISLTSPLGDLVLSRLVTLLIYSFLQESTVRIFYPVHIRNEHAPLLYYFVCMEIFSKTGFQKGQKKSSLGGEGASLLPFRKAMQR